MNLTPEERESFRQEGLDPARRKALRALDAALPPLSLNDYVDFLQGLQAFCGPMSISVEPMETRFNKL